ncbi:hypothetical protein Pfo_016792 [Paulownia fortunei]|nr:hypothetical protein Pfo_016792 [Paulownia fortunei]
MFTPVIRLCHSVIRAFLHHLNIRQDLVASLILVAKVVCDRVSPSRKSAGSHWHGPKTFFHAETWKNCYQKEGYLMKQSEFYV